jgi:large subunit ribosomal protein L32
MAQPKKKTSKQKGRSRCAHWIRKTTVQADKALALGNSILSGRNTGFVYPAQEEAAEEEPES